MTPLIEGGEIIERLGERILGRVALEDIVDPYTGEVLVPPTSEINEDHVKLIENAGIDRVKIRSVLTCETRRGICALCYGRDLARGQHGQHRRGGRRHRRAVDRRAGHAAHDAYVPHRWCRPPVATEQSSLEARNDGTVKLDNVQRGQEARTTGSS